MSHRIFTAGKLARSLFFIGFVGGLLFFLSYTFSYVANHYLYNQLGLEEPLSILEVAGIAAFIYVILFGLKFGFSRGPRYDEIAYTQIDMDSINMHSANGNGHLQPDDCETLQQQYSQNTDKLTEEQKEELKRRLAEICGIEEPQENSDN